MNIVTYDKVLAMNEDRTPGRVISLEHDQTFKIIPKLLIAEPRNGVDLAVSLEDGKTYEIEDMIKHGWRVHMYSIGSQFTLVVK